jgi:hypothetical protein
MSRYEQVQSALESFTSEEPMSKIRLILSWVFLLAITSAGVAGEADNGWSKVSNGLQARLSFVKTKGFNGTPYIITYLELRNASQSFTVMEVSLKIDSIIFELKDETGKVVPPSLGPFDGPNVDPGLLRLPHDSYLRFNITSQGAGVPANQAGLLDLGPSSNWTFPAGDKHTYFLSAKFTINKTRKRMWSGTIEIPAAKLPDLTK